ncbi:MAG: hypothetical protein BWX44_01123 [Spirochaetes bacterium ADurb.Bin001]|nr:MAG: hypothetical protein BWX44_01123 [Spirochaetes bacterium ADurb.Bin001]
MIFRYIRLPFDKSLLYLIEIRKENRGVIVAFGSREFLRSMFVIHGLRIFFGGFLVQVQGSIDDGSLLVLLCFF